MTVSAMTTSQTIQAQYKPQLYNGVSERDGCALLQS